MFVISINLFIFARYNNRYEDIKDSIATTPWSDSEGLR